MKVLVVMPFKEKHKLQMQEEFAGVEFIYESQPTQELVNSVDGIIGNVAPDLLKTANNLRWLQLNSAGTDGYCSEGILPPKTVLTNATGAYGLALSEYMLAVLLAMQKKLYKYYDNQKESLWQDEGEVTSIFNSTVLVVGLGDIGTCLATRLKALGAKVIGIKRRLGNKPDCVDELISLDKLDEYLPKVDIVANILPGTNATYHIFDKKRFALMKKGAFFINAGRGSAVIEEDLYEALNSNHLQGAAIDVTEIEPLPKDSKLWQAPNLYITPHTAGQYHLAKTLDNIVDIARENLHLLIEGKALKNIVDLKTGYKQ